MAYIFQWSLQIVAMPSENLSSHTSGIALKAWERRDSVRIYTMLSVVILYINYSTLSTHTPCMCVTGKFNHGNALQSFDIETSFRVHDFTPKHHPDVTVCMTVPFDSDVNCVNADLRQRVMAFKNRYDTCVSTLSTPWRGLAGVLAFQRRNEVSTHASANIFRDQLPRSQFGNDDTEYVTDDDYVTRMGGPRPYEVVMQIGTEKHHNRGPHDSFLRKENKCVETPILNLGFASMCCSGPLVLCDKLSAAFERRGGVTGAGSFASLDVFGLTGCDPMQQIITSFCRFDPHSTGAISVEDATCVVKELSDVTTEIERIIDEARDGGNFSVQKHKFIRAMIKTTLY